MNLHIYTHAREPATYVKTTHRVNSRLRCSVVRNLRTIAHTHTHTHTFTRTRASMAAAAEELTKELPAQQAAPPYNYIVVRTHGACGEATLYDAAKQRDVRVFLKRVTGVYQNALEGRTLGALANDAEAVTAPYIAVPTAFVVHRTDDATSVWAELPRLSSSLRAVLTASEWAVQPLEAHMMSADLVRAVKLLHDRDIAHCDVKLDNTALHPYTGHLVLYDFDSCSDGVTAYIENIRSHPLCTVTTRPPEWEVSAPQHSRFVEYQPDDIYAGDVYSTGMCVAELLRRIKRTSLFAVNTSTENTQYASEARELATALSTDPVRATDACPSVHASVWPLLASALQPRAKHRCTIHELHDALLLPRDDFVGGGEDIQTRTANARAALCTIARRHSRLYSSLTSQDCVRACKNFKRYPVGALDSARTATTALTMNTPSFQAGVKAVCAWASCMVIGGRGTVDIFNRAMQWYTVRCVMFAMRATAHLTDSTGITDVAHTTSPKLTSLYDLSAKLLLRAVEHGDTGALVGVRDSVVLRVLRVQRAVSTTPRSVALLRLVYVLATPEGVCACVQSPDRVAHDVVAAHPPIESATRAHITAGIRAVHSKDASAVCIAMQQAKLQDKARVP